MLRKILNQPSRPPFSITPVSFRSGWISLQNIRHRSGEQAFLHCGHKVVPLGAQLVESMNSERSGSVWMCSDLFPPTRLVLGRPRTIEEDRRQPVQITEQRQGLRVLQRSLHTFRSQFIFLFYMRTRKSVVYTT